jgi:hypothetical protein
MRRAAAALARRSSAALLGGAGPAGGANVGALGTACRAAQAAAVSTSVPSPSPVHPADEPFCRQRSLVPLGPRVPTMSPDAWVAPNAVVVGDVDLYDQVGRPRESVGVWLRLGGTKGGRCWARLTAWGKRKKDPHLRNRGPPTRRPLLPTGGGWSGLVRRKGVDASGVGGTVRCPR